MNNDLVLVVSALQLEEMVSRLVVFLLLLLEEGLGCQALADLALAYLYAKLVD